VRKSSNYVLSGKFDPFQEVASRVAGEAFMVPELSIKAPGVWEPIKPGSNIQVPTGPIKWLFGQRKYLP
jgi:hypothetical protein